MAIYPTRTPGPLGGLEDRMAALELQLRRVLSPTKEQYAQAVASVPTVVTSSGSSDGIGMQNVAASGAWFEWVQLELVVPEGKSSMSGIVSASSALLDRTSGGVAWTAMRFRVTYPSGATVYSVAFPSAKQSGASVVNNVCTGSHTVSQVRMKGGDRVIVGVQLQASNPDAFPSDSSNYIAATALVSLANLA